MPSTTCNLLILGVIMKRNKLFPFAALAAVMLLVGACSDDKNPTKVPEFGSVEGRVTFDGTWPSSGDVQVSIWASWPPAGPPSGATSPIASGSTIYDYRLEGLSKGTYKALTVGWRDPANPAGARVLGIYLNDPNNTGVTVDPTTHAPSFATPLTIDISNAKTDFTGLNVKADLALAQ